MTKTIINIVFIVFIQLIFASSVLAEKVIDSKTINIVIPEAVYVAGVGMSDQNQSHGIPNHRYGKFDLLVKNSLTPDYWEITTTKPIGVSISYNCNGTIGAEFTSMVNIDTGYVVPATDISMYPSTVQFGLNPKGGGDYERIFHFNPIIKVAKTTPPGKYSANILFTILGE